MADLWKMREERVGEGWPSLLGALLLLAMVVKAIIDVCKSLD